MNNVPLRLRRELPADPFYQHCARAGPDCAGRLTWEHALTFAGRQVQEKFAIIPLCEHHHLDEHTLSKILNRFIAYTRMTENDFRKYERANWRQEYTRILQNPPPIVAQWMATHPMPTPT